MKALEQFWIDLRAKSRKLRAKYRPSKAPSRLLLRLDDLDAPNPALPPPVRLEAFQEAIVALYGWSGVLPTVLVGRVSSPLTLPLVRFCHRLEAPTTLRTAGQGLQGRVAEELVDNGLDQLWLRIAATADPLQNEICGEGAEIAWGALEALVNARRSQKVGMKIGVEIPFDARAAREIPGVFREARERGADHCRLIAPFQGPAWEERHAVMLDLLAQEGPPFNRSLPALKDGLRRMTDASPGAPRQKGHCPIASQLEILPDLQLRACPFKTGSAAWDGTTTDIPARLSAHRAAIHGCKRECYHPDVQL